MCSFVVKSSWVHHELPPSPFACHLGHEGPNFFILEWASRKSMNRSKSRMKHMLKVEIQVKKIEAKGSGGPFYLYEFVFQPLLLNHLSTEPLNSLKHYILNTFSDLASYVADTTKERVIHTPEECEIWLNGSNSHIRVL